MGCCRCCCGCERPTASEAPKGPTNRYGISLGAMADVMAGFCVGVAKRGDEVQALVERLAEDLPADDVFVMAAVGEALRLRAARLFDLKGPAR